MLAETYGLPDRSQLLSLNTDINGAVECVSCFYKQRQLNDILLQLKSLQKMVEILQQDSPLGYEREFPSPVSGNWTTVSTKR
jgi:hypothetical protein